jgi:hypothetical protein
VEDGRDEVDDILRARITSLKLARERAHAALERASATRVVADLSPIAIIASPGDWLALRTRA